MPLAFASGSGPIRPARSRRRNGNEEVEKREGWFRDTQAMASGCMRGAWRWESRTNRSAANMG
jgi:hypothetical protein